MSASTAHMSSETAVAERTATDVSTATPPLTKLSYERIQAALPQIDLQVVAPYMLQLMLRNIATDGFTFVDPTTISNQPGAPPARVSRPGCILASPSYPDNLARIDVFYVYHWTRDGAIAAIELSNNPIFLNPSGVSQQLCDYVAFSKLCQDNASAANVFYRAAYEIDGTLRPWSDQKDGPALQNIALAAALPRLDPPSQATARAIAQQNLNHIVTDWNVDTDKFNLWEEVSGPSFFARAAQLRCLQEVQSTNALGLTVPANLASAITGLASALASHWDPSNGYYVSMPGGVPESSLLTDLSGYDPNSDIVMACIYGAIPCTDPKLLSTAAKVRAQYDIGGASAYPINSSDRNQDIGPLIGRYPADIYDGDVGMDETQRTKDHPWALCTANFAELCYRLAKIFSSGGTVAYDDLTGPFFDQMGLDAATVNSTAQANTVVQKLTDAGDQMLKALIYHSDDYELGEQFDADTGYVKSVTNLTWSYAAYLSAVRARP